MDGINLAHMQTINELRDGATGQNGPNWGNAEPNPPVNGVHTYGNLQPLIDRAATLHAAGRKYQLNLSPDNEWALQTGSGTYNNPGTGELHTKWLRIKPEHVGDWTALIQTLLRAVPVDYLQIGSEAENRWDGAAGFAEAVRIASTAAKAVKPDIKILAAGFNFGNSFLTGAPDTPKRVWVRQFIDESQGGFDILTLHLSGIPSAFEPTVAWVRGEMGARGYSRPIWVDDMASGPFYQAPWSSPEDLAVEALVEAGDPQAVLEYATRQARTAIIKPVMAFAPGVERVFLSTDTDWPDYYIPLWRYQGLLQVNGVRKPAFYSYEQLIVEIDGFVGVERAGDTTFKFSFAEKAPVVVVWTDGADTTVDLSGVLQGGTARVKTPVTRLDSNQQAIRSADMVVSARTVPVSKTPVFVTLAN